MKLSQYSPRTTVGFCLNCKFWEFDVGGRKGDLFRRCLKLAGYHGFMPDGGETSSLVHVERNESIQTHLNFGCVEFQERGQ